MKTDSILARLLTVPPTEHPLPLSLNRRVNKSEPGSYYGATSSAIGMLGWIEMTVLPSPGEVIDVWLLFGNDTMSDRMPREENTTVVLNRKSMRRTIQAIRGHKIYKIMGSNCWALPRQQQSINMLSRIYSKFAIERESQLTSSFHFCRNEENWVLYLGGRSRFKSVVDELFNPVVMGVKKDQPQTSSVDAVGRADEGDESPLHHLSSIQPVDWVNEGKVTGANNYNPSWDTAMMTTHEATPVRIPSTIATGPLPMPTVDWFAPSSTGQQPHESDTHMGARASTTAPAVTPAVGFYFNEQATKQLTVVFLEIFNAVQRTQEASLMLFCITAHCSQSTLGDDKPWFFERMSPEMGGGLAFTPPAFKLTAIDESCFLINTAGRGDEKEFLEAFALAGDIFEISNFMPATTFMCWSQDRVAWDLRLGMKIEEQGAVLPDCVVQLHYTDERSTTESSHEIEQLVGDSLQAELRQGTPDGRVVGRKSTSATRRNDEASPAKQVKSGL